MPKIPTYSAGNLASEHVGVPQEDQSGQIVAKALTGLASTTFDIMAERKANIDKVEVASVASRYALEMARAESEILRTPGIKSSEIEQAYATKSEEIKASLFGSLSDSSVKQAADVQLQHVQSQYQLKAVAQASKFKDKEVYQMGFDTLTQLVEAPTDFSKDTYDAQLADIRSMASTFEPFLESPAAVKRLIENSVDEKAKKSVTKAIDNGQEAEAYAAYNQGLFDSASPSVREALGKTITEALATKKYRAELKTQSQVLSDNIDMSGKFNSLGLEDIEHKLSSMRFQLEDPGLSDAQRASIKRGIEYGTNFYRAKLSTASIQAVDDPNRKAEIMAMISEVVKGEGLSAKKRPGVAYDELNKVQEELLKAFGDEQKISRKTFENYSGVITSSLMKGFSEDHFEKSGMQKIAGAVGLDLTPAGLGKMVGGDDGRDVYMLFKAGKTIKGAYDPQTMVTAFDEYLNDRRENLIGGPLTPETAKKYIVRAHFRNSGYSTDLVPDQLVQHKVLGYVRYAGPDENGRPTYNLTDEQALQLQQIKLRKTK